MCFGDYVTQIRRVTYLTGIVYLVTYHKTKNAIGIGRGLIVAILKMLKSENSLFLLRVFFSFFHYCVIVGISV